MIKQEINPVAMAALFGPGGPVMRDMVRRGLRVQALARQRCPVQHGLLRNSIAVSLGAGGMTVLVGTNVNYAMYVHEGTASPIMPRYAQALRFVGRDGEIVFRPWVMGQEGVPFLKEALIAAKG